ncbi:hypothetical protein TRICI_001247 [Trichomonascus ciferrii]|uniref:Uncharacterized protein n=1 Tax=Trichomonascus ciferrii TaxID=44093 RepID=A0A642V9X2_9ASCO|nr:hypothetical protein TRICI_001247 [Trichomonascus ciferrii]
MPFAPKEPVELDPPKDDPITKEELAKCDEGGYRVFVAKDASRALAKSSLKPEDAVPEYEDLEAKDRKVLEDWYSYFSQRYNIVGKLRKNSTDTTTPNTLPYVADTGVDPGVEVKRFGVHPKHRAKPVGNDRIRPCTKIVNLGHVLSENQEETDMGLYDCLDYLYNSLTSAGFGSLIEVSSSVNLWLRFAGG